MNKHGNKRKKALLISLSSVAILAVGLLSFIKGPNTTRIKALDEPYTLDVTSLKNGNTTLKTSNGNDIEFSINRYGQGIFLTDGYIQNVTPINGIQSLSVNFDTLNADLTISFGWFYGDSYVADAVVNGEHSVYEFGDLGPSFFKIENKSGATLTTTKIELSYSCSETQPPEGYTNVQYTLSNDGESYYVSGYTSGITTAVILSEYNGLPVKKIGSDVFKYCSTITTVSIPSSISIIGSYAFYNCDALTDVQLSNGVEQIWESAFGYCDSLESIVLPNTVTSLGWYVFEGCSNLSSITLSENLDSISLRAFMRCTSLSSVVIPDSVVTIGESAFRDSGLSAIFLPEGISNINAYAFSGCPLAKVYFESSETNWSSVTIGNNNQEFINAKIEFETETNTFERVKNNKVIYEKTNSGEVLLIEVVDKTITSFNFDVELDDLTVISIRKEAFKDCCSLTSIEIPNSVLYIGPAVFYNCSSLTSATLSNQIQSINYQLFYRCYVLTRVTIPETVTRIGSSAFSDCRYLETINIPQNVNSIDQYAFYNCISLRSIIIPNQITSIEYSTFRGCSSLSLIIIPSSVLSIDDYAFYGTKINYIFYDGIELEWESIDVGTNNEALSDASVEFETDVTSISRIATSGYVYNLTNDNRVFDFLMTDRTVTSFDFSSELSGLVVVSLAAGAFGDCSSLCSIVLPNTISSIPQSAFSYCSSLTSIVIPSSVTRIKSYAFSNSAVATVVIPKTVTIIEDNAFDSYSYSLHLILYSGTLLEWQSISIGLDNDCIDAAALICGTTVTSISRVVTEKYSYDLTNDSKVLNFKLVDKTITSIDFGTEFSGLTIYSIGDHAFEYCFSLDLILPSTIVSIGNEAFTHCYSLTTSIPSNIISIGSMAFYCCGSITSIIIPGCTTYIGNQPFVLCESVDTIYCAAESQPTNWHENWNYENLPVVWGYSA